MVSEKIAVNQHYKPCHFNETECTAALKAASFDDLTMGRYREKLVANVETQIHAIFGLSSSEFLRQLRSDHQ